MFADQHLILTLQNAVMDRLEILIMDVDAHILLSTVRVAYEKTPGGSSMCYFMMDHVCKGLCCGPGIGIWRDGNQGYPVKELATLNEIPGFVEDLIEKHHLEMISQCDSSAVNSDTTRCYVKGTKVGRGTT
jgi:hypothetical protein